MTPETAFATKDDLYAVRDELRSEIRHLSDRIDRMQLTLIAGFLSMIVACCSVAPSDHLRIDFDQHLCITFRCVSYDDVHVSL